MRPFDNDLDFTLFSKELWKTKAKQTYLVTTCGNGDFLEKYVWLFLMSGNIECKIKCSDEAEAKQLFKKVADYIREWNDGLYSPPHTNEHSTK